jgi:hypothetical protein
MSRRIPLWATLIPLALGILVWGFIWRSHKADFEADLRKVLPADVTIDAGGFPYRLEAQLGAVKLSHSDAALDLGLAADSVAINRVPWQRDRQVISLGRSQARVALSPLAGATVVVDAPEAQASLRIADSRIARLSAVWQTPTLSTGLLGVPVKAERFEAHLRETPAADGTPPPGPRLPTQAQLVLAGEGVSFGSGAALKLALDSELTAPGPIKSLAGWAQGGTAEIRSATLSDATGEVARLSATLVPENGRLRIAGTVETVCPATVRAAIAGTRAPEEKRSRMPERIAVQGTLPGGMAAAPRDPAKPPPPVRGQQPPCPALR